MTIGDLLERSVVDHMAEHTAQLRELLDRPLSQHSLLRPRAAAHAH